MLRSHSDPGSLLFEPEIERTLRRTRQARRRAELARVALDNNPFYFFGSSSDSDTQSSSSVSGTPTMAERLTLKQLGGASTTFDNQPNRFPKLNTNFELKSRLINLLPKFCGRPGEDPTKHIKDFELADFDDEESEESENESGKEHSDESEDDEVESEEESDEEDDDESDEEGEGEDWLYDLLVELHEAQKREKEGSDSKKEEESDEENEVKNVEVDDQHDKGKTFFIATLFNNKRVKEEIPAKC
ncbi:hypothetical protein PIB30_033463 [Stylosanthes scabra]|uniref:Uncharacterized protein n=1 Tax=Stylosanthes scabra TaxID=79078 RepID=A0ABU6VCK8_9FABA|nr:hypothetical protein [Stylosanthes scabra]